MLERLQNVTFSNEEQVLLLLKLPTVAAHNACPYEQHTFPPGQLNFYPYLGTFIGF